ncbi:hypothetical protein BJ508DRAFT_367653 [Ascobolus immersus RN42]|uniref:Uncharacterized protein n=1 Tax=Ascobolus immersus RN42 TaxID=1160509 RepID=A0A3N4HAW1_ASCIM|nr:hypothetical protein BJ508DRAFT_367653 [Ascobolus immersus RN42]
MRPSPPARITLTSTLNSIFSKLHPKPTPTSPSLPPPPPPPPPPPLPPPPFTTPPAPSQLLTRFITSPLPVFLEHVASHSVNVDLALHTLSRTLKLHTTHRRASPDVASPYDPLKALSVVCGGLDKQGLLTEAAKLERFRKVAAAALRNAHLLKSVGKQGLWAVHRRRNRLIAHLFKTYTLRYTSSASAGQPVLDAMFWEGLLGGLFNGRLGLGQIEEVELVRSTVAAWNYELGLRGEELGRRPVVEGRGVFDGVVEGAVGWEGMVGEKWVVLGEGVAWEGLGEGKIVVE